MTVVPFFLKSFLSMSCLLYRKSGVNLPWGLKDIDGTETTLKEMHPQGLTNNLLDTDRLRNQLSPSVPPCTTLPTYTSMYASSMHDWVQRAYYQYCLNDIAAWQHVEKPIP